MRQFRVWRKTFTLFFSTIITFALLLFGFFSLTDLSSVRADEKCFLQVESSDFTVGEARKQSTNLYITLNCNKNLAHKEDDYLS